MVAVNNFVNVHISLENPRVDTPDFSLACIFGTSLRFTDSNTVKEFSTADGLLASGSKLQELVGGDWKDISEKSSVYKAALSLTGDGMLTKYIVGVKTGTTSYSYTIKKSSDADFPLVLRYQEQDGSGIKEFSPQGSDDESAFNDLVNKLKADADIRDVSKTTVDSVLSITFESDKLLILSPARDIDDPANAGQTIKEVIDFTLEQKSVSNTGSSLSAINKIRPFFGLIGLEQDDDEILARSKWAENNKKFHAAVSSDVNIVSRSYNDSGSDIAKTLKKGSYRQTAILYHTKASSYPDARWMGAKLGFAPGEVSWMYAELKTISPTELEQSEYSNAVSKNCNVHISSGGRNFVAAGQVAEGEFIDTIIGLAWLESRIQTDLMSFLVSRVKKVPFNDDGITVMGAQLQKALDAGKKNVLEDYKIMFPTEDSFTAKERQSRKLTKISWRGNLQGAVHTTEVGGVVTYGGISQ